MGERMNEWMNQWINEWVNKSMNQWINESMSEWINQWMNQWVNQSNNESMSESMNQWINELICWLYAFSVSESTRKMLSIHWIRIESLFSHHLILFCVLDSFIPCLSLFVHSLFVQIILDSLNYIPFYIFRPHSPIPSCYFQTNIP